jgi:HSP20 family molecular chaperone IbpA
MKKSIFEDILNLQREVIRLMNEMSTFPSKTLSLTQPGDDHWEPSCDIYRCQQKLHIIFDIAGIDKDSVKIRTTREYLVISGKRLLATEGDNPSYYTMEIESGNFERIVYFPEIPLNYDSPEVKYQDGLLKINFDIAVKEEKIIDIEIT